jgi:hypothetical protein
MILIIPHAILAGVWGWLAQVLGIIQWFTVLFTGKRNQAIWKMQNDYLGYATRVMSYGLLLHDVFPPFGTDAGSTGVSYAFDYEEPAVRLTNFFRYIWAIHALNVAWVLLVAAEVVTFVAWFAILFTGRHPQGMFDFAVKVFRYYVRTNSYLLLMTDTYPKFE